ncbi:MAG: hypothetical protein O7J95_04685, partial [Planctomycetota bacterium]|nr:hypothetical protein [Planctomycetota bacterium]
MAGEKDKKAQNEGEEKEKAQSSETKDSGRPEKKKSTGSAGLKNLSLSDRVLGVIALVVIVGWGAIWMFREGNSFNLFREFFQTLSFCGAVVVAALVGLKLCGVQPLPGKAERHTLAVASLLPVVGYLIEIVTSLGSFLTVGGSIALAYISATTYWRKHIPQFARDPLGESSKK